MKNVTPIFFTSDWHVGHANSIVYDDRPFRDLDHMHATLIKRFNACVPKNATTYFLGDAGYKDAIREVVPKLNGTLVLIVGNHDPKRNACYSLGFDVVLNSAQLLIQNEIVSLSHCPLRGVVREDVTGMKGAKPGECWHGESRHQQFSVENHGQFHFHGHTHKKPKERFLGRQCDVGVVANNYFPFSLGMAESFIMKTKKMEKLNATEQITNA